VWVDGFCVGLSPKSVLQVSLNTNVGRWGSALLYRWAHRIVVVPLKMHCSHAWRVRLATSQAWRASVGPRTVSDTVVHSNVQCPSPLRKTRVRTVAAWHALSCNLTPAPSCLRWAGRGVRELHRCATATEWRVKFGFEPLLPSSRTGHFSSHKDGGWRGTPATTQGTLHVSH
jgi:hypothetical protein